MSNFIIEEERGTYTGRRHPNNGYYAFTGRPPAPPDRGTSPPRTGRTSPASSHTSARLPGPLEATTRTLKTDTTAP